MIKILRSSFEKIKPGHDEIPELEVREKLIPLEYPEERELRNLAKGKIMEISKSTSAMRRINR
jgi:hypothetical protein